MQHATVSMQMQMDWPEHEPIDSSLVRVYEHIVIQIKIIIDIIYLNAVA